MAIQSTSSAQRTFLSASVLGFRVASISTNPILGVDCIIPNNIDIITSKRQLRLPNGASHPLIAPPPPSPSFRAEPTPALSVVLAESVVFPPGKSEMIVAGIVQCADSTERYNSSTSPILFEPLPTLAEKRELVITASLANNNDGVIPVRILNVGGARKLYKGTRLGTVEEIDPKMLTGAVSSSHTADKWTPPLPDTPKLSSTERAELERLLSDYSDIFSRHSANLGRTDVLQHSIHTENERPLHQRPYRHIFISAPKRSVKWKKCSMPALSPPATARGHHP